MSARVNSPGVCECITARLPEEGGSTVKVRQAILLCTLPSQTIDSLICLVWIAYFLHSENLKDKPKRCGFLECESLILDL